MRGGSIYNTNNQLIALNSAGALIAVSTSDFYYEPTGTADVVTSVSIQQYTFGFLKADGTVGCSGRNCAVASGSCFGNQNPTSLTNIVSLVSNAYAAAPRCSNAHGCPTARPLCSRHTRPRAVFGWCDRYCTAALDSSGNVFSWGGSSSWQLKVS